MTILYLDTSALVKLYVREHGTEQMLKLAHPDTGNRLAILSFARVEFRAAVRRRAKLGDMDSPLADGLIQSFNAHLANVFQVQPVNEAVLEEAVAAIDRHALRAYDAIQLAGCLALRTTMGDQIETQFVCADRKLLEVAKAEGFTVINPSGE